MNFTGKVKFIGETIIGQNKLGSQWKKTTVVLEGAGQYPQSICVDWFNHDLDFTVGEEVSVEFKTKASEYNGKYFNNIAAVRWDVTSRGETKFTGGNETTVSRDMPKQAHVDTSNDNDDLPF